MATAAAPPSTGQAKDDGIQRVRNLITVLRVGVPFNYTVPSFSVLSVTLRQIMFEMIVDGQKKIFDGFIRDDSSLSRPVPASLSVAEHCFVDVEEFCKVVYVRHLRAMPKGLAVIWEWTWLNHEQDSSSTDEQEENSGDDEAGDSTGTGSDSSEEGDDSENMDTVIFKCIGASRELHSQEALAAAKSRLEKGEDIPVRITPEPDNPYDSNAIAFQCQVDNNWVTIGYIVKEILHHVHTAIQANAIVSVEFKWIKYIVIWSRSGPGFYAGINITRKGDWPREVRISSSTQ